MFFSVKNSREQATSQRLHFAMSREGFGKGMNTFFPIPLTLWVILAIYLHVLSLSYTHPNNYSVWYQPRRFLLER